MPLRYLEAQQAAVLMRGSVALVAANPADQQADAASGDGFRMVLYTGSVFAGHWYWGDVYLDVAGFKPTRQDLPALLRHDAAKVTGWTTKLTADAGTSQIIAEGKLLKGDAATEPYANIVRSRLAQNFPYQCSGRWEPSRVEQVQKDATATVNGQTVTGPCSIFRQFTIAEASFAEMGWDPMTSAVAASADGKQPSTLSVEIIGHKENAMPKTNLTLLASLKDLLGADRAIDLIAANPEAADLSAFIKEIGADLQAARTELATAKQTITARDQRITALEAELAAAKKAPVVATMNGDPSAPPPAAPTAGTVEAFKKEWDSSPDLQAEIPQQEVYVHFRQNQKSKEG